MDKKNSKKIKRRGKKFILTYLDIDYQLTAKKSPNGKNISIINTKGSTIAKTSKLGLNKAIAKFQRDRTFIKNASRFGRSYRVRGLKKPKTPHQITVKVTAIDKKTKKKTVFFASSPKAQWGKDNTPKLLARKGVINRLGGNGESTATNEEKMNTKYDLKFTYYYEKYNTFKKGLSL